MTEPGRPERVDTDTRNVASDAKAPLPSEVEAIIAKHRRVRNLFAGTAKGVGSDGEVLGKDTTPPQSYDFSFAVELVNHRVRDPDVLAAAMMRRPDGHAATKGDAYVAEIIARALSTVELRSSPTEGHSFTVDGTTVFDGDPPRFTLSVRVDNDVGVPITFTSAELINPQLFIARCFEKLRLFVAIPEGWRDAVETWMQSARVVTPPSEATREGALVLAVERALARMPPCESLEDLRDSRGVIADKRRRKVLLFEIEAVMSLLRSHEPKPTREEVTFALLTLGAKYKRHTVMLGSVRRKTAKCWCVAAPRELIDGAVPAPPPRAPKAAPPPDPEPGLF
jgi:hypothetical protein